MLRHTFAVTAVQKGISLPALQRPLGHDRLTITAIYLNLSPEEGEFLVAEDGAIVSSHYFLFAVNEERLDRRFLGWFIKTPALREQVKAQGSTNYAAIRPSDLMTLFLCVRAMLPESVHLPRPVNSLAWGSGS